MLSFYRGMPSRGDCFRFHQFKSRKTLRERESKIKLGDIYRFSPGQSPLFLNWCYKTKAKREDWARQIYTSKSSWAAVLLARTEKPTVPAINRFYFIHLTAWENKRELSGKSAPVCPVWYCPFWKLSVPSASFPFSAARGHFAWHALFVLFSVFKI